MTGSDIVKIRGPPDVIGNIWELSSKSPAKNRGLFFILMVAIMGISGIYGNDGTGKVRRKYRW